ncbi:MAG TPA: tripartite tricarboxylate transporter substrate binding protein [Herbaspirillum sp.]|jgi:tripartite-type tricarboxylate transporter receptor subunit TctC
MKNKFKKLTHFLSALGLLAGVATQANAASDFPTRSIRLLVGQAPGGGTDIVARLISKQMTQSLGQSVIVENRSGAAGSIAAGVTAASPPDGYTILIVSSSYAINPSLMKLPFDPLQDLVPVNELAVVPFMLVVDPRLPVKSVADLLTLAKQQKAPLTFASGGPDSSGHLAGILLTSLTKVPMTHVAYRGAGPALVDVISGHVNFMFASVLSATPLIKQGSLRAIAVSSEQRSDAMPQLPTVAESGVPGYNSGSWYGLLAPKGTPQEVIDRISQAAAKAIMAPEVRQQIMADGAIPIGADGKKFQPFLTAEMKRFEGLVQMSHGMSK